MAVRNNSTHPTRFWHQTDDGRLQCDVCPRECKLREGQRGLCYVRGRRENQVLLYTYGRSSGFCIDPIEKKPLNHFMPGTPVLSFGTAGCNLACKFCQNWDISKSQNMDALCSTALPEDIAKTAKELECASVAFTYNDPAIFLEYAIDCSEACHKHNVHTIAVTAGYFNDQAREAFFQSIDATNVDLKAFDEKFYHRLCGGHLQPVLDTLIYLKQHTNTWLEITTLIIPGENDSEREIRAMCEWIYEYLGPNTPLHFTAFQPHWKMQNKTHTPPSTLHRARHIAMETGLHFVYTGNVHDSLGNSTWCPACRHVVIERDWYEIGSYDLDRKGNCKNCGHSIAGFFLETKGHWGAQRVPVNITHRG